MKNLYLKDYVCKIEIQRRYVLKVASSIIVVLLIPREDEFKSSVKFQAINILFIFFIIEIICYH